MTENEIAKHIIDAALKIHKRFGPGLLESVYEAVRPNWKDAGFASNASNLSRSFMKMCDLRSAFGQT